MSPRAAIALALATLMRRALADSSNLRGAVANNFAAEVPGSCQMYGCNAPYTMHRSCQCNDECTDHGNCCGDFVQTCKTPEKTTEQPGKEALCSAHAACAKLSGFCCPTAEGLKLGCCSETLPESPHSQHSHSHSHPHPVAAETLPELPDSQHGHSHSHPHPVAAANVMTLYHTTSSTAAEAIVATAFRPGSNGWCGAAIYFLDFPGLPTAKMDPVHSQTGAVIEATVDLGKVCVIERPAGCLDGSSGKCCPAPNGAGFGTTGAALAGCNSIKWNPGDGWEYVIWEPERVLSKKVACSGRSACLKACQARGHSLTECGGQ